jgi:predicted dehydrogenase
MRFLNRRDFLHDSAVLAALAGAGMGSESLLAADAEPKTTKKAGPNDQLRVAVIGVNGRGKNHVHGFAGKNNCVVATICDCDTSPTVIGKAMKDAEKAQQKAPKFEQDLRRVMDDKSIDIVSIAMPNHWHALAAIWALQAGKDVYVEKPVSHNVSEGRRAVEFARKLNRICQAGTQSRSNPGMRRAIEFILSGKLGKIKLARGLCYKSRPSIGKVDGEQPIPKTIDYDLWCGPAPVTPLMRKKLHYDWHWTWDYGNGDLGNQGIHEMDKARWGLGKSELPRSVVSVGGRFGYVDDGQTANTQICVFDYGDCELIFEVRGLPTKKLLEVGVGNIFYGTDGYLVCPNYKSGVAFTPKGEVIQRFEGGDDQHHYDNFVKAVRNRKPTDLNGDILEGHLSSALCHLGNVSYRLGTMQPFSAKSKAFGDDKDAYEALARMEEHLKDNKVPLDSTSYRVGAKLAIDPKAERFVNNGDADRYLTRPYRKGYVVPDKA